DEVKALTKLGIPRAMAYQMVAARFHQNVVTGGEGGGPEFENSHWDDREPQAASPPDGRPGARPEPRPHHRPRRPGHSPDGGPWARARRRRALGSRRPTIHELRHGRLCRAGG